MKLHHSPRSPYVRKVMTGAIARGLEWRLAARAGGPEPALENTALVTDEGTAPFRLPGDLRVPGRPGRRATAVPPQPARRAGRR